MPSYSFTYGVGETVKYNSPIDCTSCCSYVDEPATIVGISITKNKYSYDILLDDRLDLLFNVEENQLSI